MTLNLSNALEDGFTRLLQRNGVILLGLFLVVNIVQNVVSQSLFLKAFEEALDQIASGSDQTVREAIEQAQGSASGAFPLAFLELPIAVLGVLWLGFIVVGFVVNVGAIRTFVSDDTERLPTERFTSRLPWVILNLIVGTILYAIIVGIGLIFLVLPGIYLAVALWFFNYEIIVEDKNAIAALSGSWDVTSGNRLLLFVLGVILGVLGFAVSTIVGLVLPVGSVANALGSNIVGTAVSVFGIAVVAQAYSQLRYEGDQGVPDPTVGQGPGAGQGPGQAGPGSRQGPNQGGPGGQQGPGGNQRGGPGNQGGQRGGGQQGGGQRDDRY